MIAPRPAPAILWWIGTGGPRGGSLRPPSHAIRLTDLALDCGMCGTGTITLGLLAAHRSHAMRDVPATALCGKVLRSLHYGYLDREPMRRGARGGTMAVCPGCEEAAE